MIPTQNHLKGVRLLQVGSQIWPEVDSRCFVHHWKMIKQTNKIAVSTELPETQSHVETAEVSVGC